MIVYRYRLAPPEEASDRDLFFAVSRCAQRYRNTLVEIERGRRAAVREVTNRLHPELVALATELRRADAEVERAITVVRKDRGKSRRRTDTPEMRAAVKAARLVAKEARSALKGARKRSAEDPRLQAQLDVIGERALELGRSAREHSGLARRGPYYGAWGTYLLAEDAAKKSFADVPIYATDGSAQDPRFVPWRGEGTVGIQLVGGEAANTVVGGEHRLLRIGMPDSRCWQPAGERTLARATRDALARQGSVSLLACTTEDGAPRYIACRAHIHRPLPDGAVVKRAAIERVNVGYGARWTLLLTVDVPRVATPASTAGGAVAVDVGWRVMGNELRIAGWADECGNSGELRLDAETLRRLREPNNIRSTRDFAREVMQLRVGAWLSRHDRLPEWLEVEARYFRQWRAPWKLLRLLNVWRERRFDGDAVAFSDLEAWAGNERWMHTQEADWRVRAVARRGDIFTNFATWLARRYDTVVLEDFDLWRVARRGRAESVAENETARSNRQLACVHGLRNALLETAAKWGRAAVKVPAANTTRTCPACGAVEDRRAAESVTLACTCGAVWDQDVTGAPHVMLAFWRERPSDAKVVGSARGSGNEGDVKELPESRRDRVARKRKEKLARMEAARAAGWI